MDSSHMTPLPQSEQKQLLAEAVRKNLQFVLQSFTDDWSVLLGVKPVKEAARVEAVVDLMALQTIVDRGGQCRIEARLMLQNRTQQFLRVKVPAGLQLWSATVADQPVKPVTDPAAGADVVLIPLVKTSPGGLPYDVNLYLAGASGLTLGLIGEIRPPAIGVEGISVQRTTWTLRLPSGYRYYRPGGNLSPTTAIEAKSSRFDAYYDQSRRLLKSYEELVSSGSQRGQEIARKNWVTYNKKIQYEYTEVQHELAANPSNLSGKEISRLNQKVAEQRNSQYGLLGVWAEQEKRQQESAGDNNVNVFLNNDAGNGGLAENVRNGYLNSLPNFVRAAAEGQKQEITREIASNEEMIKSNKGPAEMSELVKDKVAAKGTKGGGFVYGAGDGTLALGGQQILLDGKDQDKQSQVAQVLEKLQDDQRRSQERRQSELKGQLTLLGDNRLERYYDNLANQANPQGQVAQGWGMAQGQGQQAAQQMNQPMAPNAGPQDNTGRIVVQNGGNVTYSGTGNGTGLFAGGTQIRGGTAANQPGRQPMQPQGQQQRARQQSDGQSLAQAGLQDAMGNSQTRLGALDRNGRLVETGRPVGGQGGGGGGSGGAARGEMHGEAQVAMTDGETTTIARGGLAGGTLALDYVDTDGDAVADHRLAVARGTYSLPISLPAGGQRLDFQGPTGSPTVSILAVDERLVDAAHNTGAVIVIALVVWLVGRLTRQHRRRAEPAGGWFLPAYILLAAVLAALVVSGGMSLVGGIVLFGVILCPVELVHRLLSRRAPRAA
jgi:hypothetical protein